MDTHFAKKSFSFFQQVPITNVDGSLFVKKLSKKSF